MRNSVIGEAGNVKALRDFRRPDINFWKDTAESVCQADVAGYRPVIRIIFVDNAPDFPHRLGKPELVELMPVAPCDKTAIQKAAPLRRFDLVPVAEKDGELRAPRLQHRFQIIPITLFQPMAEAVAGVPAIAAPKPRLIPVHPAQYRRVFSIATHSQSDELKRPAAPQRIIKADPYPRS